MHTTNMEKPFILSVVMGGMVEMHSYPLICYYSNYASQLHGWLWSAYHTINMEKPLLEIL